MNQGTRHIIKYSEQALSCLSLVFANTNYNLIFANIDRSLFVHEELSLQTSYCGLGSLRNGTILQRMGRELFRIHNLGLGAVIHGSYDPRITNIRDPCDPTDPKDPPWDITFRYRSRIRVLNHNYGVNRSRIRIRNL